MFFRVCAILAISCYSVHCVFDCKFSELNDGGLITRPAKGKAGLGEFPWVVALYKKDSFKPHCAGSIIDDSTVITTAFCVKRIINPSELIVRAGLWDLNRTKVDEYAMQQRIASVIISHPKYSSPDIIMNDIALIRLNQPFKLTRHIQKICMADDSMDISKTGCLAAGWGAESAETEYKLSQHLKKVQMDQVDDTICERQFKAALNKEDFKLSEGFLCAGGLENDLCVGDAGAPLVCPIVGSPSKFVLTGISSYGDVKCFSDTPGVYTKVSTYRDWINYPAEIKITI